MHYGLHYAGSQNNRSFWLYNIWICLVLHVQDPFYHLLNISFFFVLHNVLQNKNRKKSESRIPCHLSENVALLQLLFHVMISKKYLQNRRYDAEQFWAKLEHVTHIILVHSLILLYYMQVSIHCYMAIFFLQFILKISFEN